MATFTNKATLIYNGQTTTSNETSGELLNGLQITKTAITANYEKDGRVAYIVTISNTGGAISGAILTDDLGAYDFGGGTLSPLSYVTGSLLFYQNGALAVSPDAVAGPPLVISGISIPAGGNVQLLYEAEVNEYAPLAQESKITNTATLSGGGIVEPLFDTATVTVDDDVALTIAKAICPSTVSDNGTLTYTFIIQNSGNTEVIATDDLVVEDVFNPILNPITVTYNGTVWTEDVEYTYNDLTGEFATLPGSITVPAATYTQDAVSGVYSTVPGVAVITVTGTV